MSETEAIERCVVCSLSLPEGYGGLCAEHRYDDQPPPGDVVPHRRLRLNLDLEADNMMALCDALEQLVTKFDCDPREVRDVTSGGVASGYHFTLTCDPDMDGTKYRKALEQWWCGRPRHADDATT